MTLNNIPFYKRLLFLLFDSDAANYILAGLMVLIFIFSLVGFSVACAQPEYKFAIWIPIILGSLSLIILILSTIRLVKSFLEN